MAMPRSPVPLAVSGADYRIAIGLHLTWVLFHQHCLFLNYAWLNGGYAMKQLRRLASIIPLMTIGAAAQQGGTGADQALEQRTREYEDALTKRDLATLDKIWSSEYTFINPRGELVTKAKPTRCSSSKRGVWRLHSSYPLSYHRSRESIWRK